MFEKGNSMIELMLVVALIVSVSLILGDKLIGEAKKVNVDEIVRAKKC